MSLTGEVASSTGSRPHPPTPQPPMWRRDRRLLAAAPLALYLASVLLVQILGAMAEPISGGFPSECPPGSQNCTRLADSPYRGDGSNGVTIEADASEVKAAILAWVEETPRTKVLHDWGMGAHFLARTKWMRYTDDLFVRVTCEGDETRVQIHSESRLGVGDLGVNDERALALADHLRSREWNTAGGGCDPIDVA